MNGDGKLAGGSLTPYVKDAWLRWTFYGRQEMTLGMQPSLGVDYLESFWGLRHIEKSPLDLYRWDSSRDTGISVEGPLNDSKTIVYRAQFGNGSGTDSETDKFKNLRLSGRYEAASGLIVEAMNVERVAYGAPADPATAKPKDDVVWRATFYWVWLRGEHPFRLFRHSRTHALESRVTRAGSRAGEDLRSAEERDGRLR